MKDEYLDAIENFGDDKVNPNAMKIHALYEIATFLERIAIAQERIATMEEEGHKRACEYADAMEKATMGRGMNKQKDRIELVISEDE